MIPNSSQIQNRLIINMNYSRKEITSWVESQTRYKFEELKNGVFFCRMLLLRFPDQTNKIKFNPNPVSQYDGMNNLTSMKKILNKYGLQLNLNIQTVLHSKNNFQLAKWFKALVDREIILDTIPSVDSSRKLSRQPSSQRITIQSDFSSVQTPRNRLDDPLVQFRKTLESAQKSKHGNSTVKRLSAAKSQNHFFRDKKPPLPDIKIPMSRKKNQNRLKVVSTQNIKSFLGQERVQDNINNLLYERALEQSIQGFEKILSKLQRTATQTQQSNFQQFKITLLKMIFEK